MVGTRSDYMSEQGRNERAAAWPARTGASAKGRIICPAALDAGGRALLDAKQLGLEQGFHEWRAIDGHERAVPSPAHVMDRRATSLPQFRFHQGAIGSRKFVVDLPANHRGVGWRLKTGS
jgi:hypothetical protein